MEVSSIKAGASYFDTDAVIKAAKKAKIQNIAKASAVVAGVGLGVGAIYAAHKATNTPVGAYGSMAHVSTNPNMTKEDKNNTIKELSKEGLKDTLKLSTAAATAAGAAALYTGVSKKAQTKLAGFVSKAGEALNKISINGTTVKETIKNSGIGKKFLNATPAAKAATLAGAAILAVATPLVAICSASKAGYIEAQNETK